MLIARKSVKMVHLYKILLSLLGIRTKLLDFSIAPNNETSATDKILNNIWLKLLSAVIFVAFIFHYPMLVSNFITHWPLDKNKKNVDFVVVHVYFYSKYFVIIIIYLVEFLTEKSSIHYQTEIESVLFRLKDIYLTWSVQQKKTQPNLAKLCETLSNLNVLTKERSLRIFVVGFCCYLFSSFRYAHVFKECKNEHFHDFILGLIPNLYISSFILHSSTIIVQYAKVFGLLNEMFQVIASDMAAQISSSTLNRNSIPYFTNLKFSRTQYERQLHITTKHIARLMGSHNEFRANIAKLRKYHSIQLNAVVLNDFLNIIFEVSVNLTLSNRCRKHFIQNNSPKYVTVFKICNLSFLFFEF